MSARVLRRRASSDSSAPRSCCGCGEQKRVLEHDALVRGGDGVDSAAHLHVQAAFGDLDLGNGAQRLRVGLLGARHAGAGLLDGAPEGQPSRPRRGSPRRAGARPTGAPPPAARCTARGAGRCAGAWPQGRAACPVTRRAPGRAAAPRAPGCRSASRGSVRAPACAPGPPDSCSSPRGRGGPRGGRRRARTVERGDPLVEIVDGILGPLEVAGAALERLARGAGLRRHLGALGLHAVTLGLRALQGLPDARELGDDRGRLAGEARDLAGRLLGHPARLGQARLGGLEPLVGGRGGVLEPLHLLAQLAKAALRGEQAARRALGAPDHDLAAAAGLVAGGGHVDVGRVAPRRLDRLGEVVDDPHVTQKRRAHGRGPVDVAHAAHERVAGEPLVVDDVCRPVGRDDRHLAAGVGERRGERANAQEGRLVARHEAAHALGKQALDQVGQLAGHVDELRHARHDVAGVTRPSRRGGRRWACGSPRWRRRAPGP